MKFNIEEKLSIFQSLCGKYERVILWGFRQSSHSHRYIHLGYFEFLSKLGIDCYWVDDLDKSNDLVIPGSLVMLPDIYLPDLRHRFRSDTSYIIHQGKTINREKIEVENCIFLYEYRDGYLRNLKETEEPEFLAPAVAFFPQQKALLQPWGTDLLGSEFFDAVVPDGKNVTFVGSAWGDKEGKVNGNIKILENIESIIAGYDLHFHRVQNVSTAENIRLVRSSRLAVCPSAIGHAKFGYLQCRVFKNISYGQLSLTDIPRFKDILGESFVAGDTWDERIDSVLRMSITEYREQVWQQQKKVRNYTYLDMWTNMLSLLDRQRE